MGNRVAKAVLFAFSLSLLVAIELGSRWYLENANSQTQALWKITRLLQHDAELLWLQRPRLQDDFFGAKVETDEFGLRNPVGALQRKEVGERRILVLGASPSFGWGVGEDAVYGRRMEQEIRRLRGDQTKVINASVVGFSSWQGRQLFARHLELFRPDHVIVSYGVNDVTRDRFFYSGPSEDKDTPVRFPGLANFLSELSSPQALLSLIPASAVGTRAFSKARPVRVNPEDYLANHADILTRAQGVSASVTLLVIPVHFPREAQEGDGYTELSDVETRAREYFARLKFWAQERNLPVVDVSDALLRDYERNFLAQRKDYIHPSETGHEIIARALLPVVLRATEQAR